MQTDTYGYGARGSTLWGKGANDGSRKSTTWGRRGGSSVVAATVGALALLVPVSTAAADTGSGTFVAPGLLAKADKYPTKNVHVIGTTYTSNQLWPYEAGVASLWPATVPSTTQGPAIAIVDSGVDAKRADFGTRVLTQVNLSSLTPTVKGDGSGHGTFVAGMAAGSAPGYAGAAPAAPIVSIRVMDDYGKA